MSLGRRLFDLRVDLTNHCNLRCVMCHMSYQNRRPRVIGFDEFRRITAGALDRVNVLFLSWGAEPLLNNDLPRILYHCAAARVGQIVMTTNLMLLTDSLAHALAQCVHTLHVSVDSADPAVFARVRRGAQLQRVMDNIRRLQQITRQRGARWPEIVFNAVIMTDTLQGLGALIDLARESGVREINLTELTIPFGYAPGAHGGVDLHAQYVDPSAAAASRILRDAFDYGARNGVFVNYPGRLSGAHGLGGLAARLDHAGKKLRTFTWRARAAMALGYARSWIASRRAVCTYPWRQMTVTPDGLVLPCCLWNDEDALGRVGDAPLLELWNSEGFRRLRRQLASNTPPPICRACRAGATKARLGV